MAIEVTCFCGKTYNVNDDAIGRLVRCRVCRRALEVQGWPADAASEFLLHFIPPPPPLRTADPPQASWIATWIASSPPGRGTNASNPALLPFNAARHLAAYPQWPLIWLGVGVAAFALAWWMEAGYVAVSLAMILSAVVYFYRRSCKYFYGDMNPGIVISTSPCRIAMTVGLAIGEGDNPSVKIISAPSVGMPPGVAVGTQVLTVTTFHNPEDDIWHDVEPEVASAGCGNPYALEHARATIEAKQWQQLNTLMQKLPSQEPGLYTFWDDNTVGAEQPQRKLARNAVILIVVCLAALSMPPLFYYIGPLTFHLPSRTSYDSPIPAPRTPPSNFGSGINRPPISPRNTTPPVMPPNNVSPTTPPNVARPAMPAYDPARPILNPAELAHLTPGDAIEVWYMGSWQNVKFLETKGVMVYFRTEADERMVGANVRRAVNQRLVREAK